MIPLVGGSAVGCAMATLSLPKYHLSYTPFANNEAHLKRYWADYQIPWHYLDKEDLGKDDLPNTGQIDFINSVCPCAGLSTLNKKTTGEEGRGSCAVQNDWMLKSAQFVLSTVRPKVLWGENAPALYQGAELLVQKLVTIGKNYGYTFSMVKTDSLLHGLPQRRVRTFYFFWKSPTVPMLSWKSTPTPRLVDYLKQIPPEASLQDVFMQDGVASERYRPYQFILEREGLTHPEFSQKFGRGTIAKYLEKQGLMDECIAWLEQNYPNETFFTSRNHCRTNIAALEHMKNKLSRGLGYWDDSLKFMGEYFSAVISKNISYAIHPTEDRFFNVRELLHLMGMPHDFEMENPKKNINHICQNVPVNTAADWAEEVVKFCRGEAEMTPYSFLRQDNTNQTITDSVLPGDDLTSTLNKKQSVFSPTNKSKTYRGPKLDLKLEKLDIKLNNFNQRKIKIEDMMENRSLPGPRSPRSPLDTRESFSYPLVKSVMKTSQIFECGLCRYRTKVKEDLHSHWRSNCNKIKSANRFNCSSCGNSDLSTEDMKTHWMFCHVKTEPMNETFEPETNNTIESGSGLTFEPITNETLDVDSNEIFDKYKGKFETMTNETFEPVNNVTFEPFEPTKFDEFEPVKYEPFKPMKFEPFEPMKFEPVKYETFETMNNDTYVWANI